MSAAVITAQLAKAHEDGVLEEKLNTFAKPKLLIIDELGYLPFVDGGIGYSRHKPCEHIYRHQSSPT